MFIRHTSCAFTYPDMFKSKYYLPDSKADIMKEHEASVKSFKYDSDADTYDDAVILPLRLIEDDYHKLPVFEGGVCDREFNFLAGYDPGDDAYVGIHRMMRSYVPERRDNIEGSGDTVIFGGILFDHFGHFITESMCRLWYAVKYRDARHKYVFLQNYPFSLPGYMIKFLEMIGIGPDRMLVLEKPMRFKKVIVPRQSFYGASLSYAKGLFGLVYDEARKSVTAKPNRKIYLSRKAYEKRDLYNEDYFEKFFVEHGFKVIYPDLLPFEEQVAYMAGADEVACTYGSLSHQILFAKEKTRLICLQRAMLDFRDHLDMQMLFNVARRIDHANVLIAINVLPVVHSVGTYLVGPSTFWKEFVRREYGITDNTDIFDYLDNSGVMLGSYIRHYLDNISSKDFFYRIFDHDFNAVNYIRYLYEQFEPDGCDRLDDVIREGAGSNPLFRDKLFHCTDDDGDRIIKLNHDGTVSNIMGNPLEEVRYWTYLNDKIKFFSEEYDLTAEFIVTEKDTRLPADITAYNGFLVSGPGMPLTLSEAKGVEGLGANIKLAAIRGIGSGADSVKSVKNTFAKINNKLLNQAVKPLVDKRQYRQLKRNPRRFFERSQSGLVRFIGKFYIK